MPQGTESWLFLRPRAAFSDDQLGPILLRALDARGEQTLVQRTNEWGFDPRTLDRVVVSWSPLGPLYLAGASLDATQVVERFWERVVGPRERAFSNGEGFLQGALGAERAALRVRAPCGLYAYGEGGVINLVEQSLVRDGHNEPNAVFAWRSVRVPTRFSQADPSLVTRIRGVDLRAIREEHGLRVVVTLLGSFSADSEARIRAALRDLAAQPLGELAGARGWYRDESVSVRVETDRAMIVRILLPWSALRALADALRADVATVLRD